MNPIDDAMSAAIADAIFPGAALLFAREGRILHQKSYGYARLLPEPIRLESDTRFDVASLTKVIATTTIAMRLYERAVLDLEQPIDRLLPELAQSPYAAATIGQLLAHRTGMTAYRPYFQRFNPDTATASDHHSISSHYLRLIAREPPEAAVGASRSYSDLGFICLGVLLERATGQSLRDLFESEVRSPLGLIHTQYSPITVDPSHPALVACTEQDSWRRRLLCGEVHDENAYVLGGAAGHSGIFTTLTDCHMFAEAIVSAAGGRSSWLQEATIERFVASERASSLGWDRPSRPTSQAGRYFGSTAVGHLGFTGCSLWVDLEQKLIAILLTNRVHPSRSNERIKEFRPRIHDELFEYYLLA